MTMKPDTGKMPDKAGTGGEDFIDRRLYVTNKIHRCLAAYENIRRFWEEYVPGMYWIPVIDLHRNPDQAPTDDIPASPTLIRLPRTPGRRKIIGMLTETEKVLDELDLKKWNVYHHQGTFRKNVPAH